MTAIQQIVEFEVVDGKIQFDAQNFHGQGCDDATRFLTELGNAEVEHKPEYKAQRQTLRLR